MSDEEDYDYQYDYSDEEGAESRDEGAIMVENLFYEADEERRTNPTKAATMFEEVVRLEDEKEDNQSKLRFDSLKHLVNIYRALDRQEEMVARYQTMLKSLSGVTSNELTDAVNGVLDSVGEQTAGHLQTRIYTITLEALQTVGNERLWFAVLARQARWLLHSKQYAAATEAAERLHNSCRLPTGADDPAKTNNLMEVYSLKIQIASLTRDRASMKAIWPKVQKLNDAISDPRIMGIIHEAFGKMYIAERQWQKAYDELFRAFKSYQEAGRPQAKDCLKYLVLVNMLNLSEFDPFDTREAKVFVEDPEIKAISKLRHAYQTKNIKEFQTILRQEGRKWQQDEVMKTHVHELLTSVRGQALLQILKPFRSVTLTYLANELQADDVSQVEELLVNLILNGSLSASIDQPAGILHLSPEASSSERAHRHLASWTSSLSALESSLTKLL